MRRTVILLALGWVIGAAMMLGYFVVTANWYEYKWEYAPVPSSQTGALGNWEPVSVTPVIEGRFTFMVLRKSRLAP